MVDTSRRLVGAEENRILDRYDAERVWLSAGRSSDIAQMKALLEAYPQWLALDHV